MGRLEDIEEIKKLKGRFCFLLDTGEKWEELVNMFTEDGVADCSPFGRMEGKTELTKFYRDTVPGNFSFVFGNFDVINGYEISPIYVFKVVNNQYELVEPIR